VKSSFHVRFLGTCLVVGILLALIVSTGAASNRLGNFGHWNDGGTSQGFVNYINNAAQWSVPAAADEWDFAGNVRVDSWADCNSRPHCAPIDAFQFSVGCPIIRGQWTATQISGTNHWASAFVSLNARCVDNHTSRQLRVVTCQEMGNLLGLKDEGSGLADETCMGDGASLANTEETPRAHDFSMLDNQIYDHND
jgi:hypothetical protein